MLRRSEAVPHVGPGGCGTDERILRESEKEESLLLTFSDFVTGTRKAGTTSPRGWSCWTGRNGGGLTTTALTAVLTRESNW